MTTDGAHTHHLRELESFFANPQTCRDSFRLLIHFAIRLAAVGHTRDVLAIVQRASDKELFQPLIDGLHLHLGKQIKSTGPSRTLALQIASRISDEIAAQRAACAVA